MRTMHSRNPASLKISKDLVDALVNYLGGCPYREVALLMNRLGDEMRAQMEPPAQVPKDGKPDKHK